MWTDILCSVLFFLLYPFVQFLVGDFGNTCGLDSWAKNKEEGDTRYCAGDSGLFLFSDIVSSLMLVLVDCGFLTNICQMN